MSAVLIKMHEVYDSLALLALKVAPDVFDLSSMQHHASIRDQIVRGQLLIRDLCRADQNFESVLVVGSGIAGVTAAMAAAAYGKRVVVVGVEEAPFQLQAGVTKRFVGPFLNEWPSVFSDKQSYPPNDPSIWPLGTAHTPTWSSNTPIAASALAFQLTAWLRSAIASPMENPPEFWLKADGPTVKAFVTQYAKWTGDNMKLRLGGKSPNLPLKLTLQMDNGYTDWPGGTIMPGPAKFTPDYVVLAAGMGAETTELPPKNGSGAKGLRFWEDDDLLNPITTDRLIGLFGGGDGALQDVLRILTGLNHPLEMLCRLEGDSSVRIALQDVKPKLQAIEQQSRLTDSWTLTPGVFAQMDGACRRIAEDLAMQSPVRNGVHHILRPGNGCLLHFVKGDHFSKAYLLNRFLVHLINECRGQMESALGNLMNYQLIFDAEAIDSGDLSPPNPPRRHWVEVQHGTGPKVNKKKYQFDLVVVRFGLERGSLPGLQMIQISHYDRGMRTSLAHVPVPFMLSGLGM